MDLRTRIPLSGLEEQGGTRSGEFKFRAKLRRAVGVSGFWSPPKTATPTAKFQAGPSLNLTISLLASGSENMDARPERET